jgi:hypothetical protein
MSCFWITNRAVFGSALCTAIVASAVTTSPIPKSCFDFWPLKLNPSVQSLVNGRSRVPAEPSGRFAVYEPIRWIANSGPDARTPCAYIATRIRPDQRCGFRPILLEVVGLLDVVRPLRAIAMLRVVRRRLFVCADRGGCNDGTEKE